MPHLTPPYLLALILGLLDMPWTLSTRGATSLWLWRVTLQPGVLHLRRQNLSHVTCRGAANLGVSLSSSDLAILGSVMLRYPDSPQLVKEFMCRLRDVLSTILPSVSHTIRPV